MRPIHMLHTSKLAAVLNRTHCGAVIAGDLGKPLSNLVLRRRRDAAGLGDVVEDMHLKYQLAVVVPLAGL